MSSASGSIKLLMERLQKVIDKKKDEWEDETIVESCKDCLDRLHGIEMTLDLLSDTLVGATVAKFKAHPSLGGAAKRLVSKWKQIAKGEGASSNKSASKKSGSKKSSKAERRGSLQEVSAEISDRWSDLPPNRQSICQKLYDFILLAKGSLSGMSESAMQQAMAHTAVDVEAALNTNFSDKKTYSDKARSIAFNFKKNQPLVVNLIFGTTTADELVHMSPEELASEDQKQARAAQAKSNADSRRLDWEQANEDKINEMCGIKGDLLKASLFTCGRCKSVKTTSTQKQTRSADEPMTVFVLCMNCGNRWKC